MIQPDIFIFETLRVFILIISFRRIFQNSFCEIQAAVTVDISAHQIIHAFFFCFSQIRDAIIQFHICVGFFLHLRCDHCYLASSLTFFFHFFGNGSVLKSGNICCQLIYICFQSFLIHFLRKIILPRKFSQVFQCNCQHLFQGSMITLKIRIDQRIVQPVNNPDQFHRIFRAAGFLYQFHKRLHFLLGMILSFGKSAP